MITPPSPGLPALAYAFAIIAAILAVLLARKRREHAPVAVFLSVMVSIDLARLYLRQAFDLGSPGPYDGARRVAFYVDVAGFAAWPCALVALSLVVLLAARPAWLALLAWVALVGNVVGRYPSDAVRGPGLQRVYLAAELVALAVVAVLLGRWGAKRARPSSEHAVLLLLVAIEAGRLLGFYGSIFDRWGSVVLVGNVVLYAVLCAVQGVYVWTLSRST